MQLYDLLRYICSLLKTARARAGSDPAEGGGTVLRWLPRRDRVGAPAAAEGKWAKATPRLAASTSRRRLSPELRAGGDTWQADAEEGLADNDVGLVGAGLRRLLKSKAPPATPSHAPRHAAQQQWEQHPRAASTPEEHQRRV